MNISSRRIAASGALALGLAPVLALTAMPAFAGTDLDAVAEGMTESGYYVDSGAKYYQRDGAQELLRHAQGRSVPLVDYHLAMSALPDEGISGDGIHPSVAPAGACRLDAAGLSFGYNLRNQLSLTEASFVL